MLQIYKKNNKPMKNITKTMENTVYSIVNITKPMKKQWFQYKTLQNQWKNNNSNEKQYKTNGKPYIFNRKALKPMENNSFSMTNQ